MVNIFVTSWVWFLLTSKLCCLWWSKSARHMKNDSKSAVISLTQRIFRQCVSWEDLAQNRLPGNRSFLVRNAMSNQLALPVSFYRFNYTHFSVPLFNPPGFAKVSVELMKSFSKFTLIQQQNRKVPDCISISSHRQKESRKHANFEAAKSARSKNSPNRHLKTDPYEQRTNWITKT